jgi:hypothetical protein
MSERADFWCGLGVATTGTAKTRITTLLIYYAPPPEKERCGEKPDCPSISQAHQRRSFLLDRASLAW